jgi:polyisoprenoid-binding protein YceI
MATTPWGFDFTHSTVGFHARHMVVAKVHGSFKKWGGELLLDEDDLTRSSVSVQLDAASLDTHLEARDEHLRSADFLNAAAFPQIAFKSTRIEKKGEDAYRVTGDLTIRDTTKPVVLEAEFNGRVKSPWGDERAGFSAKASIDRREFGLVWNKALEAGGVLVGDKVEITIEVEAVRQAVAKTA